ncbi:MAG TPA: endonuclease/exonuclease/phosphatase family protein [Armatimonadota bacterium]|nr:endonuclease/exonuclease/phosphatase family protein [Armatimonadota bacterium]
MESAARAVVSGAKTLLAVASVALAAALSLAHALGPNRLAAMTVLPVWTWVAPGIALGLLSHGRGRRKRTAVLLAIWTVSTLCIAEEPRQLLTLGRPWPTRAWVDARERGTALRVITLNCCGSARAINDALSHQPDILLVAESPTPDLWLQVRKAHPDYSVLEGFDASIVARGPLRGIRQDAYDPRHMMMARATIDGRVLNVIALRLPRPYFALDLWEMRHWKRAAASQRHREKLLASALRCVRQTDPDVPLILGGDFNTPAGDRLLGLVPRTLTDVFTARGIGLGNTYHTRWPLTRIDHIYVSHHITPEAAVTRRARGTDHRMVIGDVRFAQGGD